MANSKISQLKVGETTYDITLPSDATPTIATLSVSGSSNLTDVNVSGNLTASVITNLTSSVSGINDKLGTQVNFTYSSNILYISPK